MSSTYLTDTDKSLYWLLSLTLITKESIQMTTKYQLYVDNIGKVWEGNDPKEATSTFDHYKQRSLSGFSRAGGEAITLFEDGDISQEYIPEDSFEDYDA